MTISFLGIMCILENSLKEGHILDSTQRMPEGELIQNYLQKGMKTSEG